MILPRNHTQNSQEVNPEMSLADAEVTNQMKISKGQKPPNIEQFKDRIDTLIVVSTLIITATFAGGFSLPGGNENGVTTMLNRTMFHFYIFCITISMYVLVTGE